MDDWRERKARKQRVDATILGGPGRVLRGFRELGPQVFREGAISKKHKELMALAVAVSQNCFD